MLYTEAEALISEIKLRKKRLDTQESSVIGTIRQCQEKAIVIPEYIAKRLIELHHVPANKSK